MPAHLRIARPVRSLAQSASMYRRGLGLQEIGRFEDHAGFDGVMLGDPASDYHLEFTHCRARPIEPSATPEDLLVLYIPDPDEHARVCASMLAAGFVEVEPFNPYWSRDGRSFEDPDGYRVVLQRGRWSNGGRAAPKR